MLSLSLSFCNLLSFTHSLYHSLTIYFYFFHSMRLSFHLSLSLSGSIHTLSITTSHSLKLTLSGHSLSLSLSLGVFFLYFRLFNTVDSELMNALHKNSGLWCQMRPFCQLSHNHCPSLHLSLTVLLH